MVTGGGGAGGDDHDDDNSNLSGGGLAVPSREVCRRKGSHIHDWRSARQPISSSIGD
jgi:hypothetical protein